MGLFDFLKPKPKPVPEREGPSPDYALVHVALRQIALQDPLTFLGIATSPDFPQILAEIMSDVEKFCGRPVSYPADQIMVHPTRVGNYPCAILEFPEPQEMAEAYLVAVVGLFEISDQDPPEKVKGRYFTLEKGFTSSEAPRTVLCEWDEQCHANYGDGPPAHPADFAAAIHEILMKSGTNK